MRIRCLGLFVAVLFSMQLYGQVNITLTGVVTDSLGNPLEFANVLAIPRSGEKNIAFSITEEKGRYNLSLQKNVSYDIEISFVGFKKATYTIEAAENALKDFILSQANESLKEVTVSDKYIPVIVKEDTIIYRISAFATGEERKLREVLKKLPGIEVDKEGNVTVNGKKVDKLMVEGQPFFYGGTKLGVDNIPANVVENVEVLNNYSDVPFLKGLTDEDKMAMNIKLKEGKKRFVFGDLEAGAGVKERYLGHPTLFYYSPKTSVNAIGDLNNTGNKSFTFNDYINFEGGLTKFIENPVNYFNLANSDFVKSLINKDITASKDKFGAFNIHRQFSPKIRVNAYSILNDNVTEAKEENNYGYILNNQLVDEEKRHAASRSDNKISLNKLEFGFVPNANEDVRFSTTLKTSDGKASDVQKSMSLLLNNNIDANLTTDSWELKQDFGYSRQISNKHTTTFKAAFQGSKNNNARVLNTTWPIFPEVIPVNGSEHFTYLQDIESRNHNFSLGLKHYWSVNNYNHVYPVLGYNYSSQQFQSTDFQLLGEQKESLTDVGFNNETVFSLRDPYAGIQYKAKAGDLSIRTGMIYHQYFWNISQFGVNLHKKTKTQLLPDLLIKWDIKSSESLDLQYRLTSLFNDVTYFANRLSMGSFNSLYRGNYLLENSLTHEASIYYYRFNQLRGISYNMRATYSQKEKSIQNTTDIDGINQINTFLYTELPDKNLRMSAAFSKTINKYKLSVNSNGSLSDNIKSVNSKDVNYRSRNIGYIAKMETNLKKYPNLTIGFTRNYSVFYSESFKNSFIRSKPFGEIRYQFLKDFNLNVNYSYESVLNKDKSTSSIFHTFNASLYYRREDSPWGFEIEGNNLFDTNYRKEYFANEFIVSDTRIYVLPRTLLFKVSYKL